MSSRVYAHQAWDDDILSFDDLQYFARSLTILHVGWDVLTTARMSWSGIRAMGGAVPPCTRQNSP